MNWRRFFERKRRSEDFAEELAAHVAHETDENAARGMDEQQAAIAALRKLGNRTALHEEIHRMNSFASIESVWQDFRYATRTIRANPVFAVVAVLSLALGVGANGALFQLIDAALLRSLPVSAPEQLVRIELPPHTSRSGDFWAAPNDITNPQWEFLRGNHQPFSSVSAWGKASLNLSAHGPMRFARVMFVSGEFFDTLGLSAALGRLIAPADDRRGCGNPAAIISDSFWRREFGGSSNVLGQTATLDGHLFPIVGVTPSAFTGVDVGQQFDAALPVCAEERISQKRSLDDRQFWWLGVFGRLKPGVSIQKANAYVKSISPSLYRATLSPQYQPDTARDYLRLQLQAAPGRTGFSNLRSAAQGALLILFCLSGFLLLIAGVNLTNLMLARAAVREHEMGIRRALGASRWRLVQQLLIESLLISTLGSLTGALLARLLSSYLIASLNTSHSGYFLSLDFDFRFAGFLVATTFFTCLLIGLAPALRLQGRSPNACMKQGARGATPGRERFYLQRILMTAQISLALILVVGSLLFVKSFQNLVTLDPGFRTNGMIVARVVFRPDALRQDQRLPESTAILQKLRAIPGVDSAAAVNNPPLLGAYADDRIHIDGDSVDSRNSSFNFVSEGYFETMGIPRLSGRAFRPSDDPHSMPVAIVDETFATRFLGARNPIGHSFYFLPAPGETIKRYRVVGLVGRSKYSDLERSFEPIIYLPIRQQNDYWNGMNFEVHSEMPANATMRTVEAAIMSVNSQFSIDLRSFPAQFRDSIRHEGFIAKLSSLFGLLAVFLASVGLYGMMSYIVTHRRSEISIRLAIGASRRSILLMVLRQSTTALLLGSIAGAAFSLAFSHVAQSLLFAVTANDPWILLMAALALAVVTITATFIPARRAANLDPMETLRNE